jgi:hypothetical protein
MESTPRRPVALSRPRARQYVLIAVLNFRQSEENDPKPRDGADRTNKFKENVVCAFRTNWKFLALEQRHFCRKSVLRMNHAVHSICQNRITGCEGELLNEM